MQQLTPPRKFRKFLQKKALLLKLRMQRRKIKDISPYELVIVGSGMQMGKWIGEAQDFLKNFKGELRSKKVAIFASTMKSVSEREGKLEDLEKARKINIDDIVTKYGLNPVSTGFFGGVLDFNKMNFVFRRTFGFIRPQLEKDGFKEKEPGVYDLRDFEEIRVWSKELAGKVTQ